MLAGQDYVRLILRLQTGTLHEVVPATCLSDQASPHRMAKVSPFSTIYTCSFSVFMTCLCYTQRVVPAAGNFVLIETLPTSFLMALDLCLLWKRLGAEASCLPAVSRPVSMESAFRMPCQMVSRVPCKVLLGVECRWVLPLVCRNVRHLHEYFLPSPILHDKLSKEAGTRINGYGRDSGLACGRYFFFLLLIYLLFRHSSSFHFSFLLFGLLGCLVIASSKRK